MHCSSYTVSLHEVITHNFAVLNAELECLGQRRHTTFINLENDYRLLHSRALSYMIWSANFVTSPVRNPPEAYQIKRISDIAGANPI